MRFEPLEERNQREEADEGADGAGVNYGEGVESVCWRMSTMKTYSYNKSLLTSEDGYLTRNQCACFSEPGKYEARQP